MTMPEKTLDPFLTHPGYLRLQHLWNLAETQGFRYPYFRQHEGPAHPNILVDGKPVIEFSSYNYLGLASHPEVIESAQAAIDQYGTSVGASRIVSGERPVHEALEKAIAELYETDAALAFVSGHATNVSVIAALFGPSDLILYDRQAHNSIIQGIKLSGARSKSFPHNDLPTLTGLLTEMRHEHDRVVIITEGLYSMDGDLPDLRALVSIKQRFDCLLMVDEAHSLGVLGKSGLGIREHARIKSSDVDIWMGTLSKSLASCGGYIAGSHALIQILRYWAAGFMYSVGMPPANAAAALKAIEIMRREPERVQRLQAVSRYFLDRCIDAGLNTGTAEGYAVVPVWSADDTRTIKLANLLFEGGISVQPIIYPAVGKGSARLRFFLTCEHTETMIDQALDCLMTLSNKAALAD